MLFPFLRARRSLDTTTFGNCSVCGFTCIDPSRRFGLLWGRGAETTSWKYYFLIDFYTRSRDKYGRDSDKIQCLLSDPVLWDYSRGLSCSRIIFPSSESGIYGDWRIFVCHDDCTHSPWNFCTLYSTHLTISEHYPLIHLCTPVLPLPRVRHADDGRRKA